MKILQCVYLYLLSFQWMFVGLLNNSILHLEDFYALHSTEIFSVVLLYFKSMYSSSLALLNFGKEFRLLFGYEYQFDN